MNDKKLLELAAKAAGDEVFRFDQYGNAELLNTSLRWNPLTDDGDAFRLAVKLNLNIGYGVHPESAERYVCAYGDYDDYVGEPCVEAFETDASIATKYAITRAAAEIGRGIAQPETTSGLPDDDYYQTMAEAHELESMK